MTLLAASLLSCSVKEDRDGCPCWLDIDLSGCERFTDMVSLKGWTADSNVLGDNVYKPDFDHLFEAEVPRGSVSYCASSGLEASLRSGMSVVIPEGAQSDMLYAYRADVITLGETAYDKVCLHKQYATVLMKFEDESTVRSITVRSDWNGLDLATLQPVRGTFSYTPAQSEDRTWSLRLPRQGDDSLTMEVTDLTTGRPETFDLGEIISKTGYDWTAEDLDDIYIGIDWARGEVSIRIEGWDPGHIYTTTI